MSSPMPESRRSSVEFQSFHIDSHPASRRASPSVFETSTASDRASATDSEVVRDGLARVVIVPPPTSISSTQDKDSNRIYADPLVEFTGIVPENSQNNPVRPVVIKGDPWTNFMATVRVYDERTINDWKEDVDTLLIFAGLFSAVLTAFNVESYKFLQQDPEDTAAALLRRISAQLAASQSGGTTMTSIPEPLPFRPDARSVRINILWFSSLVLSLVSASVGILTKQWMREYTSETASSPRENARIRQLRHDGFVRWQIPLIIALLPIFLQVSLALFFAGLLDLLWGLNSTVAVVITVVVSISLTFLVATTVMPTIRSGCPYKSPQAMGIFLLVQFVRRVLSHIALGLYSRFRYNRREWPILIPSEMFNPRRRRVAVWLLNRIQKTIFGSWRDREKEIVRASAATLDRRVLAGADATFMSHEFLGGVVRPCMKETHYTTGVDCLMHILTHRADGIRDGVPYWKHGSDNVNDDGPDEDVNPVLLHLVLDILPRIKKEDEGSTKKMLMVASPLCEIIPFHTGDVDVASLARRVIETLAGFLDGSDAINQLSFRLIRNITVRVRVSVKPLAIQALIAFALASKEKNDLETFQFACEVVLILATVPDLPPTSFDLIRLDLYSILQELETHLDLAVPQPDRPNGGGQDTRRTAAIIVALLPLVSIDANLISSRMMWMLEKLREDGALESDSDSLNSAQRLPLQYAQVMRRFQRGRRNALDSQDISRIQDKLPVVVTPPQSALPSASSPTRLATHAPQAVTPVSPRALEELRTVASPNGQVSVVD